MGIAAMVPFAALSMPRPEKQQRERPPAKPQLELPPLRLHVPLVPELALRRGYSWPQSRGYQQRNVRLEASARRNY
jgi:hypothetical protein